MERICTTYAVISSDFIIKICLLGTDSSSEFLFSPLPKILIDGWVVGIAKEKNALIVLVGYDRNSKMLKCIKAKNDSKCSYNLLVFMGQISFTQLKCGGFQGKKNATCTSHSILLEFKTYFTFASVRAFIIHTSLGTF